MPTTNSNRRVSGRPTTRKPLRDSGTFSYAAHAAVVAVDPAIGVIVDVQNTLTVNALLHYGTPDQKKKYLPKIVSGDIATPASTSCLPIASR